MARQATFTLKDPDFNALAVGASPAGSSALHGMSLRECEELESRCFVYFRARFLEEVSEALWVDLNIEDCSNSIKIHFSYDSVDERQTIRDGLRTVHERLTAETTKRYVELLQNDNTGATF